MRLLWRYRTLVNRTVYSIIINRVGKTDNVDDLLKNLCLYMVRTNRIKIAGVSCYENKRHGYGVLGPFAKRHLRTLKEFSRTFQLTNSVTYFS